MKKILCAVLAVVLCLCLVACGGEQKDAMALYKSAMTKVDKENMAAKMAINMAVEAGTEAVNVDMDLDVAAKKTGSDTTMAIQMKVGAQGMTIDMGMYLADGYYYMDILGMKVKQSLEQADEDLTGQLSDISGKLLLDSDAITIEKSEKKDGNTVISFTVSADKMNELVKLLNSQAMDDASNITVESVAGTVTIDSSENLVAETMDITYSMEAEGVKTQASMTMKMTDIQFGDSVKVELPDNLDEYVESDDATGFDL